MNYRVNDFMCTQITHTHTYRDHVYYRQGLWYTAAMANAQIYINVRFHKVISSSLCPSVRLYTIQSVIARQLRCMPISIVSPTVARRRWLLYFFEISVLFEISIIFLFCLSVRATRSIVFHGFGERRGGIENAAAEKNFFSFLFSAGQKNKPQHEKNSCCHNTSVQSAVSFLVSLIWHTRFSLDVKNWFKSMISI